MLVPRMSLEQRDAIASPATGLLIYQTTELPGFYYFTGSSWLPLRTQESKFEDWSTVGNSGTNGTVNFLGTKDNQPLSFRVNNVRTGYLGNKNGNIFWGMRSGAGNTAGYGNIAIGTDALHLNAAAFQIIAIGDSALYNNIGYGNVAIGAHALTANTIGGYNTAIGTSAMMASDSGSHNTAVGYRAMWKNKTGEYNSAFGFQALSNNTSGLKNSAFGMNALMRNATGESNSAFGVQSMQVNSTGDMNTAMGYGSLGNNLFGSGNTAAGFLALDQNVRGEKNAAFGYKALVNNTGNENSALGADALRENKGGIANTALGFHALRTNVVGIKNTALGHSADVGATHFTNSTAIGANALVNSSNAMVLGSIAGVNDASESVTVGIGTTSPQHMLHIKATSEYDFKAQLCLEEASTDFVRLKFRNMSFVPYWDIAARSRLPLADSRLNFFLRNTGDVLSLHGNGNAVLMGALTQHSDARLKINIQLLSNSLAGILALSGYHYQWKDANRDGGVHIGLLAQEVKERFPELVVADDQGILSVNYQGLVPVLIEAVKEQQKMIEEHQQQLTTQMDLIQTLQRELNQLKNEMKK